MEKFNIILCASLFAVIAGGCDDSGDCGGIDAVLDEETGRYVVVHPETGATWMRCPVGQKWKESSCKCEGEAAIATNEDYDISCPEGFDWPVNDDYATILCNYGYWMTPPTWCPQYWVYDSCKECTICDEMFKGDTGTYASRTDIEEAIGPGRDEGPVFWMFDFKTGCLLRDVPYGTSLAVRCIMTAETQ